MTRIPIILAAMVAMAGPAAASPPRPVCANPEVLDRVAERLRARDPFATINRRSVTEAPTATGNVLRCGVCVTIVLPDVTHPAGPPMPFCEPHSYVVRALPTGFVLLALD